VGAEVFGYGSGWLDTNTPRIEIESNGAVVYTNSTDDTYMFAREGVVKGEQVGLRTPPELSSGSEKAILCPKAEGPTPCPKTLPKSATYDLWYLNKELPILFKGTSGTLYPFAVEYIGKELETPHYKSGLSLPTSWTDSAKETITYTESKTLGYTAAAFTAGGESVSYVEKPDASGSEKLTEFTSEQGQITQYTYGTGSAEGLLTSIKEPNGTVAKVVYDTQDRASQIEVIPSGQTSGPTTKFKYYEAGEAPAPCGASQKETVLEQPDKDMVIYCSNVLDEVERVAHRARLGEGPATPLDFAGYDAEIPVAINVVNGNAILLTEDLFLPGGNDVFAAHTLNTLAGTPSSLGPGWQQNWGPDVGLAAESGGAYVFTDPTGYRDTFLPNGSGGYTAEEAEGGTLTKSGSSFVVATVAGDTYTFAGSGLLTAYEDANGGRFEVGYTFVEGQERLKTILEPGGGTLTAEYGEHGLISKLKSSGGESVTYEYAAGWEAGVWLLTKISSSLSGKTATVSYSPSTWMVSEISVSGGHHTILKYDALGRITTVEQIDESIKSHLTANVSYGPPTNSVCESQDVSQTTVAGGQDEEEAVYCINAKDEVTNPHEND
jgi:YD repeat-containing protein